MMTWSRARPDGDPWLVASCAVGAYMLVVGWYLFLAAMREGVTMMLSGIVR